MAKKDRNNLIINRANKINFKSKSDKLKLY